MLSDLSSAFSDVFCAIQQCLANVSLSPTSAAQNICPKLTSVEPGRPAFDISAELLEDLTGLGFSHTKIAEMLGVSRWTISRRIKAYSLDNFTTFSKLPDDELDQKVGDYIQQHGATSGQVNKLTTVFHASVLLLLMSFVITLSKELWIHEAIAEWIRRLL